ncbi:class A beta-lactamase [Terriglobus albidus]|uniref:Beta-lactamase n=1 Tax=Terriglobus albidus TaxID=1592106 RepID=A0A5B9EF56_9BACT|nr:class A beta-lactamase [Terriglobus albidus]QEE29071.1 class A beta-lactamase [Terriglobus albidus]
MPTRRAFLASTAAVLASSNRLFAASSTPDLKLLEPFLAQLEKEKGGRLGVSVLDTQTGAHAGHRAGEAFPMCSTFKLSLAAQVLARVDHGEEKLDRLVTYTQADLLSYAPVTKEHVATGMTVGALCEAAITLSDNTAANLLLVTVGGPAGFTRWLRSLGDTATRLDRNEPTLNSAEPGDQRDTTTPSAMLATLQKLTLGNVLSPASRKQLNDWMLATQTGLKKIKAGLPADWKEGDKTGSGDNSTTNDIAVLYPPDRKPVLITVYYTGSKLETDQSNLVFQEIGRKLGSLYV